jgi:hypothetical protein
LNYTGWATMPPPLGNRMPSRAAVGPPRLHFVRRNHVDDSEWHARHRTKVVASVIPASGEYEVPAPVEPDTCIDDSAVLRRALGETPS